MIERVLKLCRRAVHALIIAFVRPYIVRELPGWGRVYTAFMGSYERDWFWRDASPRVIRGKLHGYTMRLDPTNWADRSAYFLGRWYDLDTQQVLAEFVAPGDTVVDIGANRGMFALTASRVVGPTGRVVCFEPNPNCYQILRREISDNDISNIDVRTVGLGDTEGDLILTVPHINSGEGTFGQTTFTKSEAYRLNTSVMRGDVALENVAPALIKIDVEGFECRVLAGLVETIRHHHPVLLAEVIPEHLERCGASAGELIAMIESFGYSGFVSIRPREAGKRRWQLVPFDREKIGGDVSDVLWLHSSSAKVANASASGLLN